MIAAHRHDVAKSDIYVFDIATDPARPRLVKTITDLAAKTGKPAPLLVGFNRRFAPLSLKLAAHFPHPLPRKATSGNRHGRCDIVRQS